MNNYSQILYAARSALSGFRSGHDTAEQFTLAGFIKQMEEQFPDNVDGPTLLKALMQALYDASVHQLSARDNLGLIAELTGVLSKGKLAAYSTVAPTTTGPQWLNQIQQLVEITLEQRIATTAQAAKQLAVDPADRRNELSIHERHRLELWASGLVPPDLHQFTQSTTVQGHVLALPQWEFEEVLGQPDEPTVKHLFITRLPHLFWGDSTTGFAQLIAEQLALAYVNPEPTDCAIIDAIFTAVVRALDAGLIALGNGDSEKVRPTDGFVFFIDTVAGTVVGDPQYINHSVQTLDPESIRPHGTALAEAQERQEQLLAHDQEQPQ